MRRALAIVLLVPAAIACEQIIGASFSVESVECKHATPPPPPAPLTGGTTEILEAVHAESFGEETDGGYRLLGFDGDGKCTQLGEGPSCAVPKWLDAGPIPDGIDGRDNGLGSLISSQQIAFGSSPFASAKVSDEIDKGIGPPSALFRLRGYNGYTNDTDVEVDWFLPANPAPDAGAPAWGATPVIDVTSDSADSDDAGAPVAKWHASKAYVASYQLVAQFESASFRVASVPFPMRTAILTADLGKVIGHMSQVMLWGVVGMNQMFDLMPDFTQYVTKAAVCRSSGLYPIVKGFFCQFTDIRIDGKVDPTLPCDGLSFAVSLETRPVKLGAVVPEQRPVYCMPNDDPKGDSCDNAP